MMRSFLSGRASFFRLEGPAHRRVVRRRHRVRRCWIPVDISEAWKAKEKRDYFFGSLDANRVRFSTGRDITLSPKQNGPPLNYFVYPYIEIDGKSHEAMSKQFSFEELIADEQMGAEPKLRSAQ